MREFLPQPSTSTSQTVQVEYSSELTDNNANDIEGAADVMATLDERENLV